MDAGYFSALVGLAGAAIGSFSSFTTTVITQRAQLREKVQQAAQSRREQLFVDFITEASRLYGDAVGHQREEICDLVTLYALVARMRLFASPSIVQAAERVMESIIAMYQAPNRSLGELKLFAHEGGLEPLLDFSERCREELISKLG